jgi:hypothetical protein
VPYVEKKGPEVATEVLDGIVWSESLAAAKKKLVDDAHLTLTHASAPDDRYPHVSITVFAARWEATVTSWDKGATIAEYTLHTTAPFSEEDVARIQSRYERRFVKLSRGTWSSDWSHHGVRLRLSVSTRGQGRWTFFEHWEEEERREGEEPITKLEDVDESERPARLADYERRYGVPVRTAKHLTWFDPDFWVELEVERKAGEAYRVHEKHGRTARPR